MARTTPGLDFLGRKLFIPLTLFFVVSSVIPLTGFRPATWQLLLAPLLGTTAYTIAALALSRWVEKLEAARIGACLAPQHSHRHPIFDKTIKSVCGGRAYQSSDTRLQDNINQNRHITNISTMWTNNIVTSWPEHVKIIVTDNPENYIKGEGFSRAASSTLGTGVFTTDGSLWKFHRSVVRPLFLHTRHPTFLELYDRHTQHAIAHLDTVMEGGYSVDLLDLFRRTSLNIVSDTLLGTCVSNLPCSRDVYPNRGSSFPPEMDFATAILRLQNIISRREELGPFWPLHEILGDKTKESMGVICETLDPLISTAMRKKMMRGVGVMYSTDEKKTELYSESENETLLHQLVELTDESYQIKDVILNILIPQRDNVALTLTSMVYYLALHPHITSRLREEVFEILGPTRRPTGNDLAAMKYLRAVIDETLRLAPPVPRTIRETIAATTWPSLHPKGTPIYIPAHTRVSYDVSSMHRSKNLWGPDADQFDPERFLDTRYQEYLSSNPYIFLPFGGGQRSCFGENAAYNEISIMIIRFLQAYGSFNIGASVKPLNLPTIDTHLFVYKNKNDLELRLDEPPHG